MDEDQERKNPGVGLTWWVRYAIVPVAVALIAGVSAVRAADLLKPVPTGAPVVTVIPQPTGLPAPVPTDPEPPDLPTALPPTALPTPVPTGVPIETPAPALSETPIELAPTAEPAITVEPVATTAPETILGKHTVQRGETLYCIGRGYGVLPQAISQANHLSDPSLLRAGQVLAIPDKAWRDIPSGPVCVTQFFSPYAGRAVNVPIIPRRDPVTTPEPGETQPPAPVVDEPPVETPVATAPPVEAPGAPVETPSPYPPPEGY